MGSGAPEPPDAVRRRRLLDLWSAVGIASGLVLLGALILLGVRAWWWSLPPIIGGYAVIEALARGGVLELLLNVTVALAAIGAVILLITHWLVVLAGIVVGIGVITLRENLGEMRRRTRPE